MKVDIFNTNKKYSIIYADPPWEYRNMGKIQATANSHYATMKQKDIRSFAGRLENRVEERICRVFQSITAERSADIQMERNQHSRKRDFEVDRPKTSMRTQVWQEKQYALDLLYERKTIMNEVKKIAKILDEAECVEDALFVDFDGMVKALVNAGYGDVKQAVREFAEKMKERLAQKEVIKYKVHTQEIFIDMQATVIIDKLVKGVCGE